MEKELEQNAPIVEEEKLQNYRKDDDAEEMEKAAKEFKNISLMPLSAIVMWSRIRVLRSSCIR